MDFFERKLDDKNRLTIPKEIRDEFEGQKVIIAPGFGDYLHMYPEKIWTSEVLPALSGEGWSNRERPQVLDVEIADLNEQLKYGKVETVLDDKQGRVALEPHLLRYAGIDTTVAGTRIVAASGSYWRLRKPKS